MDCPPCCPRAEQARWYWTLMTRAVSLLAATALRENLATGFVAQKWDTLYQAHCSLQLGLFPCVIGQVQGGAESQAQLEPMLVWIYRGLRSVLQERCLLQPVISPNAALSLKSAASSGCQLSLIKILKAFLQNKCYISSLSNKGSGERQEMKGQAKGACEITLEQNCRLQPARSLCCN